MMILQTYHFWCMFWFHGSFLVAKGSFFNGAQVHVMDTGSLEIERQGLYMSMYPPGNQHIPILTHF